METVHKLILCNSVNSGCHTQLAGIDNIISLMQDEAVLLCCLRVLFIACQHIYCEHRECFPEIFTPNIEHIRIFLMIQCDPIGPVLIQSQKPAAGIIVEGIELIGYFSRQVQGIPTNQVFLSQVTAITGLEAHTVQNWVKRGFLTSPVGKKYSLRQLCRILNIHMLHGAMPIDRICKLLSYVNGHLDDESDDMIDDSQLYFLFVNLASHMKELYEPEEAEIQLDLRLP